MSTSLTHIRCYSCGRETQLFHIQYHQVIPKDYDPNIIYTAQPYCNSCITRKMNELLSNNPLRPVPESSVATSQSGDKRTRIFDSPSNHNYGPTRRMWVILSQLNILDSLDTWYSANRTYTWDLDYSTGCIPSRESEYAVRYLKFWLSVI